MRKSKFTDAQISFILKQADEGTSVAEVCRKAGIAEATFYNWRKKYAGLIPSEMKRLKQLEEENSKLKDLVVLPKPNIDSDLGLPCGVKPFGVEHFFSQGPVEAFVVAILPWRARIDLQRLDTDPFQPVL